MSNFNTVPKYGKKKRSTVATADATPVATSPLLDALRAEITELLAKPVSARSMLEIEKTASIGRQLVALKRLPQGLDQPVAQYDEDGEMLSISSSPGVYMSNPGNSETFGSQFIREAVASLPLLMQKQAETPANLIAALIEARRAGLDDIAMALEAKLLGKAPAPAAQAPKLAPKTNGHAHAAKVTS